jgi:prepilin-type processing-associated H-X9-DG protein
MLHDAKLVDDLAVFDCPCNGHDQRKASLPDYARLCELNRSDPNKVHHALCGDYAYNLGYRHASGQPGPLAERASAMSAVLSDAPRHEGTRILEGNSPNHGGIGQNVLFSDGHVGWRTTRRLGPQDGDLFLNNDHKAAPGADAADAVLAPGCIQFFAPGK